MSPRSLMRSVYDSLLPDDMNVKYDGDFDKFLDAISDCKEITREFLEKIAYLRIPQRTEYLSDLEKEYGFMVRTNLSETVRRDRLDVRIYERSGRGTKDDLQNALDRAGFNVQVHENNPAVDPTIFLNQAFQMVAGDPNNAFAGDPGAYAGRVGGELLVNGAIYDQRPLYLMECGDANAYAGDPYAYAGYYLQMMKTEFQYEIPTDSGDWPLVFFVGGDATRDPVTDELTDIELGEVPLERKQEFKNIILRIKPMHSWAGLILIYT